MCPLYRQLQSRFDIITSSSIRQIHRPTHAHFFFLNEEKLFTLRSINLCQIAYSQNSIGELFPEGPLIRYLCYARGNNNSDNIAINISFSNILLASSSPFRNRDGRFWCFPFFCVLPVPAHRNYNFIFNFTIATTTTIHFQNSNIDNIFVDNNFFIVHGICCTHSSTHTIYHGHSPNIFWCSGSPTASHTHTQCMHCRLVIAHVCICLRYRKSIAYTIWWLCSHVVNCQVSAYRCVRQDEAI